jgi:hypothetical protein
MLLARGHDAVLFGVLLSGRAKMAAAMASQLDARSELAESLILLGVEGRKLTLDGRKAGGLETSRFRVESWGLRSPWFAGSQRVEGHERLDVGFEAL